MRRPGANAGKAVVLWEETGKCTMGAAGVRVLARRERFAEITSGGCYFQQGLTATCQDLLCEAESRRQQEDLGSSHEFV